MKTGGGPCGDPLQRRGRPGPVPRSPLPREGPGRPGRGGPRPPAVGGAARGGCGRQGALGARAGPVRAPGPARGPGTRRSRTGRDLRPAVARPRASLALPAPRSRGRGGKPVRGGRGLGLRAIASSRRRRGRPAAWSPLARLVPAQSGANRRLPRGAPGCSTPGPGCVGARTLPTPSPAVRRVGWRPGVG